MKTTVFTDYHIAAGAKMAEFAGYNMPIEFTGITDEHLTVRQGAGVFDVSHMGEIWVKGPKAEALLQRITTNDVAKLYDGKVQYSCMPNGRGGIVDDILVYRIDAETYMLCVNAANIDKDWAHICAVGRAEFGMEAGPGKELYNASDEICQLAVQGPLAMKIVQKMCAEPVEEMEYYTFRKMEVAGCRAILSITGYTGAGGCEIYVANEDGAKLWKALWEAGAEYGRKGLLPLRQRHRRRDLAAGSGPGLDHEVRRREGFHRPSAAGTSEGRGADAQARGIEDGRARDSASRLPAGGSGRHGDRACNLRYDVALPENGRGAGLRGFGVCETRYGGCGRHPREAREGRGGQDTFCLTNQIRKIMKTEYLGLELSSPVIVSSSPYTSTLSHIESCVRAGAGAVVLKSIFEEQIYRQAASLDKMEGYGDAGEYLERYLGDAYKAELLQLVADAAKTGVPVIGSINCVGSGDAWIDYATSMQAAGASALELNIFLLPTDRRASAAEIEQHYADIVRKVCAAVTIPVSVKLPMRLTNVLSTCDTLLARGAKGVVLFNRFFEPDIDIEKLTFQPADPFSQPTELRHVLRSTALCSHALPQLDISVSTGVHDGAAAVKALLCGASAVQLCTAIHKHGYEVIGQIGSFIDEWAARHGFDTLSSFRGRMDYGSSEGEFFQRVQYMKYFPHDAE